jgi:hypothetical protein
VQFPFSPPHPLAAIALKRLRGHNALSSHEDWRRLVAVSPATHAKLKATAKTLTRQVGFFVWPFQVAALLVEQGAEKL